MVDPAPHGPQEERGAPSDVGPRREPPSYDADVEGYTGISEGALGALEDVDDARAFAEMIVDTIREGLLVLDFDHYVRAANESFYRMFGARPEETVGRLVYELGSGEWDLPELRALLEGVLPHEKAFNDFKVDHDFEGVGRRVVVLNARRLNHHQMILLALEDVTERRRAERELRASEERFRLLVENAHEYAIFSMDEEKRVTMWSPGAQRILGWSREEALGMSGAAIFTAEDRAAGVPERETERARAEGSALDERWHVRKDGSRFWASGVMVALRDGDSVLGFAKILRDNTERKEAEEALRQSEERMRRAQQAARVGTWEVDLVTGEVTWSEGVFDLVGLPPEGGVPSADAWRALLHPDDRERVDRQVRAAIASGGSYENEFRVVRPDGEAVWVAAKGHIAHDGAGRPLRLLGANYDVTARKRTEEALRELNETLEEVNETLEDRVEERTRQVRQYERRVRELARALALAEQEERRRIAHVLHDDLQQVLFGARMALSLSNTDDLGGLLEEATELTRTLSHELSPPFLEGEDVEDLLRWVAERQRTQYGLEVEVEAGGNVPVPEAALRVLLYQVVRELLFNVAKHAGTGRARLVAARVDDHVRLVVEDEGAGFDPAVLGVPSAVGLGLRSVRERVELVGGRMEIVSEPGVGTRVTITVPVGDQTAGA